MKRYLLAILAICLLYSPAAAVVGDLNRDGTVDFDDFFLLADHFGQSGPSDAADTIVVVQQDTVVVVQQDTVVVVQRDTIVTVQQDTVVVVQRDTIVTVQRDTVERIIERPFIIRDTVFVTLRDTIFVNPDTSETDIGTTVIFGDPNLEAVVRAAIGRPTGSLFTSHVAELTFFDATNSSIAVLTGIEHLGALTSLALSDNQITDISPLRQLTHIVSLNLANNQIRSIAPLVDNEGLGAGHTVILLNNPLIERAISTQIPALEARGVSVRIDPVQVTFSDTNLEAAVRAALGQMSGEIFTTDVEFLTFLDASNRGITDLSGIEYLKTIEDLSLENNQIASTDWLATLTGLTKLDLSRNQVNDVSTLAQLTDLRVLRLDENRIADVFPLANLTSLAQLNLQNNQIREISPLMALIGLTDLWIGTNPLNDEATLVHIPEFVSRQVNVRF